MEKMNRKILLSSLAIIFTLGITTFISYRKFSVINPFSTVSGLFQIAFTEKEYVEIQEYPKVIVAKSNASLQDYMETLGFKEDRENQMGALHRFRNNDSAQYVMCFVNKYFSKWRWQE